MSQDLRNKAIVIRDEQEEEANTTARVGGWMVQANDEIDSKASKEDLANVTTNFKGYKSTVAKLKADFPSPESGWYAYVGDTGTIWEVAGGQWTNSGKLIPEELLELDEYAKKVNDKGDQVVYAKDGVIDIDITPFISKGDVDYIVDSASSPNVFDKTNITPNKTLSGTTGKEEVQSTTFISNYIPVSKGDTLYLNSDRVVAFYDKDKNLTSFLKPLNTNPSQEKRTITLSGNHSYMRFVAMNEWLDSSYCFINVMGIVDGDTDINHFDKKHITPNKTLSGGSGQEVDQPTTSISNYILIEKGDTVRFNSDRVVAFYDQHKVLLSFIKAIDDSPSQEGRDIKIQENYSYMRFVLMNEWLDSTYCYINLVDLYNPNDITPNKTLGGGGVEEPQSTTFISNYIPIIKGTAIYLNSDRVIVFYDEGKNIKDWIPAIDNNPQQRERTIEIVEDYSFVRFAAMNEWRYTSFCNVSGKSSYSGIPASKILYNRLPIDPVFVSKDNKTLLNGEKILIKNKTLPEYLESLSSNIKPYMYKLRRDMTNAVVQTDNSIIVGLDNKVVKYGLDGIDTVLLEVESGIVWQGMWKYSTGDAFMSPMKYGGAMNVNSCGLFKYDGTEVKKVIQLKDRECIWRMDEDSKGNIYAGVYCHDVPRNTSLYKSVDGGDTFTIAYNWGIGDHVHCVSVDKANDNIYVALGDRFTDQQIFKSTNGGTSFSPIINDKIVMSAMLVTENYRFLGTDHPGYGKIYRTNNDSTLEVSLDVESTRSNVFFLEQSDLTGWIYAGFKTNRSGGDTSTVWVSKDEGDSWELVMSKIGIIEGDGFWFISNFKDGNAIVINKYEGLYLGYGISELSQPIYGDDGITGTIIKPMK